MPKVKSYPDSWKQFGPVGSEEVERDLMTLSSISSLHPCPSWVTKASWGMSFESVLVVMNFSLVGVVPLPLKEAVIRSLLKLHHPS